MGRIAFSDIFCMAFICGWASGVVSALSVSLWMFSGIADAGVLSYPDVGLKGVLFLLVFVLFGSVFYQAIWLPLFFVIGKLVNYKGGTSPSFSFIASVIYGVAVPYGILVVLMDVTIVAVSSLIVTGCVASALAAYLFSYVHAFRRSVSAQSESGGRVFFYPRWAPGNRVSQ